MKINNKQPQHQQKLENNNFQFLFLHQFCLHPKLSKILSVIIIVVHKKELDTHGHLNNNNCSLIRQSTIRAQVIEVATKLKKRKREDTGALIATR